MQFLHVSRRQVVSLVLGVGILVVGYASIVSRMPLQGQAIPGSVEVSLTTGGPAPNPSWSHQLTLSTDDEVITLYNVLDAVGSCVNCDYSETAEGTFETKFDRIPGGSIDQWFATLIPWDGDPRSCHFVAGDTSVPPYSYLTLSTPSAAIRMESAVKEGTEQPTVEERTDTETKDIFTISFKNSMKEECAQLDDGDAGTMGENYDFTIACSYRTRRRGLIWDIQDAVFGTTAQGTEIGNITRDVRLICKKNYCGNGVIEDYTFDDGFSTEQCDGEDLGTCATCGADCQCGATLPCAEEDTNSCGNGACDPGFDCSLNNAGTACECIEDDDDGGGETSDPTGGDQDGGDPTGGDQDGGDPDDDDDGGSPNTCPDLLVSSSSPDPASLSMNVNQTTPEAFDISVQNNNWGWWIFPVLSAVYPLDIDVSCSVESQADPTLDTSGMLSATCNGGATTISGSPPELPGVWRDYSPMMSVLPGADLQDLCDNSPYNLIVTITTEACDPDVIRVPLIITGCDNIQQCTYIPGTDICPSSALCNSDQFCGVHDDFGCTCLCDISGEPPDSEGNCPPACNSSDFPFCPIDGYCPDERSCLRNEDDSVCECRCPDGEIFVNGECLAPSGCGLGVDIVNTGPVVGNTLALSNPGMASATVSFTISNTTDTAIDNVLLEATHNPDPPQLVNTVSVSGSPLTIPANSSVTELTTVTLQLPPAVDCGPGTSETIEFTASLSDTCSADDILTVNYSCCGNGQIDPGETCDWNGGPNSGICRTPGADMCTFCGDGEVQGGVEQCDDGNSDDTDACANDCTINSDGGDSDGDSGGDTGGSGSSGCWMECFHAGFGACWDMRCALSVSHNAPVCRGNVDGDPEWECPGYPNYSTPIYDNPDTPGDESGTCKLEPGYIVGCCCGEMIDEDDDDDGGGSGCPAELELASSIPNVGAFELPQNGAVTVDLNLINNGATSSPELFHAVPPSPAPLLAPVSCSGCGPILIANSDSDTASVTFTYVPADIGDTATYTFSLDISLLPATCTDPIEVDIPIVIVEEVPGAACSASTPVSMPTTPVTFSCPADPTCPSVPGANDGDPPVQLQCKPVQSNTACACRCGSTGFPPGADGDCECDDKGDPDEEDFIPLVITSAPGQDFQGVAPDCTAPGACTGCSSSQVCRFDTNADVCSCQTPLCTTQPVCGTCSAGEVCEYNYDGTGCECVSTPNSANGAIAEAMALGFAGTNCQAGVTEGIADMQIPDCDQGCIDDGISCSPAGGGVSCTYTPGTSNPWFNTVEGKWHAVVFCTRQCECTRSCSAPLAALGGDDDSDADTDDTDDGGDEPEIEQNETLVPPEDQFLFVDVIPEFFITEDSENAAIAEAIREFTRSGARESCEAHAEGRTKVIDGRRLTNCFVPEDQAQMRCTQIVSVQRGAPVTLRCDPVCQCEFET